MKPTSTGPEHRKRHVREKWHNSIRAISLAPKHKKQPNSRNVRQEVQIKAKLDQHQQERRTDMAHFLEFSKRLRELIRCRTGLIALKL